MDEPLFLNPSPAEKTLEKLVSYAVIAFAVFTVAVCVFGGFSRSANHVFFGFGLAGYTMCLFQLFRWYRLGDLDPKFKYLLAGQAITLTLLCIVANVYVW